MESGLGRGLEQWGSSRGGGTRIVEFKSREKAAEVCLNYFSRVKHRVQTRRGPELMDSGLGTRIVRFKSREAAQIVGFELTVSRKGESMWMVKP